MKNLFISQLVKLSMKMQYTMNCIFLAMIARFNYMNFICLG